MTATLTPGWADFQPSRLQGVRARIVQVHPHTRDRLRAAPESRLAELRRRIEEARDDGDALRRLAHELTAAELRGLAGRMGPWAELREPIATILEERPLSSVFAHLWSTWQRYPRVPELRRLLDTMADNRGWESVAEGYDEAAATWVAADVPAVSIQQWLDGQGLTYSDMAHLAGFPLRLDAPLATSVREAVMTHGSAAQLRAEGADNLREWFPELSPEERKGFGWNYLTTVDIQQWQPAMLMLIRQKYGLPKEGRDAFWKKVPEERRGAFHRWFIKKNLEDVLGEDSERTDYWFGRADDFVKAESGTAGGTRFVVMYFEDGFTVIEFLDVGNAAYFYPADMIDRILDVKARKPGDLKEPMRIRFGPRPDNRLLHHSNWKRKADRMVQAWKRNARP